MATEKNDHNFVPVDVPLLSVPSFLCPHDRADRGVCLDCGWVGEEPCPECGEPIDETVSYCEGCLESRMEDEEEC